MTEELEVLQNVCLKLEQANIAYMLTGSFAANFYAVPRMTRDIDIVIQIQKKDADKLTSIFQNDFYIDKDSITTAIDSQGMFNIIHNNTVLKVDFIIRKDSPYRIQEFQRRKRIQLNQSSIWIVSLEDLIISKLYWAKDSLSEMQLKDVKNLLLNQSNIDFNYISKWVKSLELDHVYDRIQKNG